ncbi:MAG: hypothetical protein NC191_05450 [Muribaculaceae bacterium]|nr:hypothetical protein [Muribaculaceae bacterium]
MNYLELINKCLLELNYKKVNAFSELVKNDHKRIMNILNIINKEVCNIEGWNFLLRRQKLQLSAHTTELPNTINGRIKYLFINGKRHDYSEDFEQFLTKSAKSGMYTEFADKLLFPEFDKDMTVDIIYYTRDCACGADGKEKSDLTVETDSSLIPLPFAEQILVYGTCLRLKGNPQYYRFSYWMSMYKEALANLKSKTSVSIDSAPMVNLYRV